jgi:hypothetical protein
MFFFPFKRLNEGTTATTQWISLQLEHSSSVTTEISHRCSEVFNKCELVLINRSNTHPTLVFTFPSVIVTDTYSKSLFDTQLPLLIWIVIEVCVGLICVHALLVWVCGSVAPEEQGVLEVSACLPEVVRTRESWK